MPTTVYRCDFCGKVYQTHQEARNCENVCLSLKGRFDDLIRIYTQKFGAEKADKLSEEARQKQLDRKGHPSVPDEETIQWVTERIAKGVRNDAKKAQ